MPVLLLSEVFPPRTGGSGRWLWEVYSRFPAGAVRIAAGEHEDQEAFDRTHSLPITRLPLYLPEWGISRWRGLHGYWRNVRGVRRIIKQEAIREIHCGRCLPEGWVAWLFRRLYGLPYLCFVHGEDVECAAASRELSWMVRRVLAGARLLIANSHNTAGLLRDNWNVPAERVKVLHPGVDTTRFVPVPPDPDVRRRLGWEDRTVLLTVGRLQKRKGHDMMIRALPHIRAQVPNVLHAVIGEGEERPVLEQLARELDVASQVQLLGEMTDDRLVRCYQQCDLFVLPNRQVGRDIEGFGMVLLEAQACGKPVVAGASGGTAETMRIPQTGRTVPCDEPGPLAELVAALLASPAEMQRMGQAARTWVVENFDWVSLSRQAQALLGTMTSG
jgi:phosphatidylinositol alpha-1,6-mannosyltransferase